ncbi:DUF7527 domain-containing protein [Natrarchaeobius oligotrophus]|uniref:Transcriptional regulator n=1 Tax=Natrarchaeobius chitinivorans TaxID=1679083 RepID=A0A3N6MFN5_NATCH|nr:transcriptional regulator [Natrarchaeobius chitinivorans]RQG99764.1 transcriptional regulator [Natrarchaeobius chitinivorans]
MHSRTKKRVEQWDSRPFSGGYDGLSDLADRGFSGAVSAAGAWLFMLNGRIVGVFDGDLESFEAASGTIYQAPHPSLPLLCCMEERGGDSRARYYTNETPLEEVDETLQDGSFTGYVELSENVLSGDYYAVYYGGRRMAAAFIGNAERLVTGDEAFERANDEVGIYEVIDVDVDVTDVPDGSDSRSESGTEPGDGSGASIPGADSELESLSVETDADVDADPTSSLDDLDVAGVDASGAPDDELDGITTDDPSIAADPDAQRGITADETTTDDDSKADSVDDSGTNGVDVSDERDAVDVSGEPAHSTDEPAATEVEYDSESASDDRSGLDPDEVEAAAEELDRSDISWTEDEVGAETEAGQSDAEPETERRPQPGDRSRTPPDEKPGSIDRSPADDEREPSAEADDDSLEERFEEEAQWRSTRSIPSIDPDNTQTSDSTATVAGSATKSPRARQRDDTDRRAGESTAASGRSGGESRANGPSQSSESTSSGRTFSGSGGVTASESRGESDERIERLQSRIEELESRRRELETKTEELATERDHLRSENDELSATVERLQSRIEELENELERTRARGDRTAGSNASTQLPAEQALSGTNLFVRYGSKSHATLEMAHAGDTDRADLASNLQIEHHTEFDAGDVAVGGRSYAEFLSSTMEYQFVDWLTEVLLFEIRDTGHADGLGDLYDALPRIDRAELHASISLEDDDTENVPDQLTFDVVAYDKMGNPLIVVNLNDSREPATREMLEEMEAAASAVKANYPDLAAAMVVTSSYFDPGALEVTEQATSSGFLSRGSKRSYVNLSRKQGYHLCLVESRSEGFHMNAPEL